MAKIIEARDLSLAFGDGAARVPVLGGFSLFVERGEFVALVGSSGVGKSTVLRILAGLIRAGSGTVRVFAAPEPGRRPVALVFQEARLLPWRRVVDNVVLGLEGLDVDREERRRRAGAVLEIVGLGGFGQRWPHELSGGQRQRVGIARALAVDPEVLLMDEPFGAVDAITRQILQDELLRIWRETHKSILFVTHDIEEAVYLADRVALMAGAPARVTQEYAITEPRPRKREQSAFQRKVEEVRLGLSETFAAGLGI